MIMTITHEQTLMKEGKESSTAELLKMERIRTTLKAC